MAQIAVSYGGDPEFRAFVYGVDRNQGTISYLENQLSNLNNLSNVLTASGQKFFSDARALYESYNGAEAIRLGKAALNKVENIFARNDIHYIAELARLQNAPLIMQRFIMAQPDLRQMYHNQRCSGYSDTYFDVEPGLVGDDHYDYRRVMQGILITNSDGTDMFTTYLDELKEGDRELTLGEQSDIRSTWKTVAKLLGYGNPDPTDPFNNSL